MHWVNKFAVSLLLFPLILCGLVVWMMMIAYYDVRLVLRDLAIIASIKRPIFRYKFDVMTFTQCWTERRKCSRTKKKTASNTR